MAKSWTATPMEIFKRHLHYEMDMLLATFSLLEGNKITNQAGEDATETVLQNALIESFCIHARNLDYFFSDPCPRENDASATEYAEGTYEQPSFGEAWTKLIKKVQQADCSPHKIENQGEDRANRPADRHELISKLIKQARMFEKDLKPEYQAVSKLSHYRMPATYLLPTTGTKDGTTTTVGFSGSW